MTLIKERVLQIAEFKRIVKETFFSDLGLSYANFKGVQKKSALSSDALVIILSKYADVNPVWLLTGKGDIFVREGEDQTAQSKPSADHAEDIHQALALDKHAGRLQELAEARKEVVQLQQKVIAHLEEKVQGLEGKLATMQELLAQAKERGSGK